MPHDVVADTLEVAHEMRGEHDGTVSSHLRAETHRPHYRRVIASVGK